MKNKSKVIEKENEQHSTGEDSGELMLEGLVMDGLLCSLELDLEMLDESGRVEVEAPKERRKGRRED